ncbi:Transforming acidic coiled-coil-containing protein 3 [Nowakowskiella sp. JEL0407]|nr:Transforming acidic coiled-coil-containing protein 3 [Nowakowskiella sp. JEL0407]
MIDHPAALNAKIYPQQSLFPSAANSPRRISASFQNNVANYPYLSQNKSDVLNPSIAENSNAPAQNSAEQLLPTKSSAENSFSLTTPVSKRTKNIPNTFGEYNFEADQSIDFGQDLRENYNYHSDEEVDFNSPMKNTNQPHSQLDFQTPVKNTSTKSSPQNPLNKPKSNNSPLSDYRSNSADQLDIESISETLYATPKSSLSKSTDSLVAFESPSTIEIASAAETPSFMNDLKITPKNLKSDSLINLMSPDKLVTPKTTRQVTAPNTVMREFDPLIDIPKDWMIKFESPVGNTRPEIKKADEPMNWRGIEPKTLNPPPSLLDTWNQASPSKVLKYSDKDMEDLRRSLTQQHDKEFELAQQEIQELSSNYTKVLKEYEEMSSTILEWELSMKDMIAGREKDQEKNRREAEKARVQLEKMKEERERLQSENDMLTLKYKQLRIEYEEVKEREETLRNTANSLSNDVNVAEQRMAALKSHAEEKLTEANKEIIRAKAAFEKEVSALKTKILRAELHSSSLEKELAGKKAENEELTKICDGLLAQMEVYGGGQ